MLLLMTTVPILSYLWAAAAAAAVVQQDTHSSTHCMTNSTTHRCNKTTVFGEIMCKKYSQITNN